MAKEVGCCADTMYAAFQLLHTDCRESTFAAMMKGPAPKSGLTSEKSIRRKVWPLMKQPVERLEHRWLTAQEVWLHHAENLKYKNVLVDPLYARYDIIGSGEHESDQVREHGKIFP